MSAQNDVPVPDEGETQNAPEGVDVAEPDDLVADDVEAMESSELIADTDIVIPDDEFDVEPTGDDPDEDDDEA